MTGYPFEEGRVAKDQKVWLGVRPEHIKSGDAAKTCTVQMEARVELVEPMGSDTQIWSVVDEQNYRFRVDGQTEMAEGDSVPIGFDPQNLSLFDRDSELRL